jgi:hypothetical protein
MVFVFWFSYALSTIIDSAGARLVYRQDALESGLILILLTSTTVLLYRMDTRTEIGLAGLPAWKPLTLQIFVFGLIALALWINA